MPKLTNLEAASELRKLAVLLDDPSVGLEECGGPIGSANFYEALHMAIDSLSPSRKFICRSEFTVEAENAAAAMAYALRVAKAHTHPNEHALAKVIR